MTTGTENLSKKIKINGVWTSWDHWIEPMPAHPKPKKLIDPGLCQFVRELPCLICGQQRLPNDTSHIKTRGSGGDDRFNVVGMCRNDHIWFENLSTENKQKLIPYAIAFTHHYDNGEVPIIIKGIGRGFIHE